MEVIIKRKQRRSFVLSVKYPQIICLVPHYATQQQINDFISNHYDKASRIYQSQKKYHPNLLEDELICWLGKDLKLIRLPSNRNHITVTEDMMEIEYKQLASINKLFDSFVTATLTTIINQQLTTLQAQEYYAYDSFQIKHLSASWGRCSSTKKMSFARKLVYQDITFIHCVVAHEYTHLKHLNHSKAFYEMLYRLCPQYPKIIKKEKTYD